jgi:lon-related putative ATP-dependent protease
MTSQARELTPEEITFICDPNQFEFDTTDQLPDLLTIIGQERAVRAIDFGVHIPSNGFNVYVTGLAGSGRNTTVMGILNRKAAEEPAPDDWCYVNNFADTRRPRAIRLPPGRAAQLRDDMAEFIRDLQRAIPAVLESEDFHQRAQAIAQTTGAERNRLLTKLSAMAEERGFGLMQTATGLIVVPVLDGQPVGPDKYETVPAETRQKWESEHPALQQELGRTLRELRALDKASRERLRALTREVTDFVVGDHIDDLEVKYQGFEAVLAYLKAVRQDIIEHVTDFRPPIETTEETSVDADEEEPGPPAPVEVAAPQLSRYQVNVIVDHGRSSGAPVIFETNPTYANLVGRIESEIRQGLVTTSFAHIRAGCLHRANGGYLVMNARDLLEYPLAWDALKRTLRNQEIRTETMSEAAMPAVVATSLEPECIPFRGKVILIGDWTTYAMLYDLDDDFRKVFKVRADFGQSMDRTSQTMHEYAQFTARRVRADGLLPFDRSAVARIVEVGARQVDDQQKLSTRFAGVVEVIHEASYWATRSDRQVVTAADVNRAVEENRYRVGHLQEQLRRQILEGIINVATEGSAVGQVNGLTVLEVADHEFAIPSRISAQTYMGRGNVVVIDREANLSGNIHNKGVLILQGFLGARYAQHKGLNLSASLTFEQNYDRIEGDSASSAELYALLSSLSGLPVRQDLAVTGSVDQQGRVQAIGAVTAKIEGFFDICQARGLTGSQGVVIPVANVKHLMLREDVVQAVRDSRFHIYAVAAVDEGIGLLTGVEAGVADAEGNYPEGSVNERVQKRLLEMAEEKSEREDEGEDCGEDGCGAAAGDAEYADDDW